MTRKPPIKHVVRGHERKGKPVQSFTRGSGTNPKEKVPRRRTVGKTSDIDRRIREIINSNLPSWDKRKAIAKEIYTFSYWKVPETDKEWGGFYGGEATCNICGKKHRWKEYGPAMSISCAAMGKHIAVDHGYVVDKQWEKYPKVDARLYRKRLREYMDEEDRKIGYLGGSRWNR